MIYSFLIGAAFFFVQPPQSTSTGLVAGVDSTYTFSGKIEGLGSGWVYLRRLGDRSDSVKADRDSFMLAGSVAEPEFCSLEIRTPVGHTDFRVSFFLQSGRLRFSGKEDAPEKAVITGGSVQDEYQGFTAKQKVVVDWSAWRAATQRAKEKNDKVKTDSLEKASEEMEEKEKQFAATYASEHPASYVAVFELFANYAFNPDPAVLGGLYNGLDEPVRASYFGRQLKDVLDGAERTAIGKPAPDFTQKDISGKPVTLSSFKGRFVLVDFWASWCGPCRLENPAVVKAYQHYQTRGFTILGVSLDDKKDKWAAAIRKDRLDWTQVSDLKGWQNSVAGLYGIKGIPMNYLLDKDGKIIAKGLRGEELEKKLEELVH